jgi:hydroxymethylpyrimidine/phosphomethylpyrimidine kinase
MIVLPTDERVPPRPARALVLDTHDPTGPRGLGARERAFGVLAVQIAGVATGIRGLTALPERLVAHQLDAALAAGPTDAVLLADLSEARLAAALVERLADTAVMTVLDPCLVDRHGQLRHAKVMAQVVRDTVCGASDVLVVNAGEVERLTGRETRDVRALREGGRRLFDTGVKHIVLCGGRIEGHALDLVYDGRNFTEFGADRVSVPHPRGQGAAFASLLTAHLARGVHLHEAVERAKGAVTAALAAALPDGVGHRVSVLGEAWRQLGVEPQVIEVVVEDFVG